jgi:hypothetical protein
MDPALMSCRYAADKLDCRVKPGNDQVGVAGAENQLDSRQPPSAVCFFSA